MVNSKRTKFSRAVKKLSKDRFASEDILSSDLADRIGSLSDKCKVTIRLDLRVINEAKKESERLGVGYQKIINDRLLEIYSLADSPYLHSADESISEVLKDLQDRLSRLEKKQLRKEA